MPKDNKSNVRLTAIERRNLLKKARLVHRQAELDIRSLPRDIESSRLPGRILIITPRKVGNAPQRNLLRRRLKAIFREEKIFEKSHDMIIYCRKGAAGLTFQDLKSLLVDICKKLPSSRIKSMEL